MSIDDTLSKPIMDSNEWKTHFNGLFSIMDERVSVKSRYPSAEETVSRLLDVRSPVVRRENELIKIISNVPDYSEKLDVLNHYIVDLDVQMSNSYLKRLIKQEKLDNQTVVNLRNGMRDLRDKMFIYRPKLEPELIQDLDLSKFIGKYNDGTDQARLKNKELIQQIRDVFDWDKIKDKSWDNNDKTVSLRFWSNRLDYIDSLIDRIDEKKLSLHEIDDLKYVAGMVKNNWYLNHKVMEKSSDDVRVDFFNHLDSLDNKLTFKYLYANQKIESKIDQLYSQVPKSVREFRSKLSRAQVIGDVRIKKTADIINYIGTALDSDSHFIAINGQVTQLSSLSERFIAVRELAGKLNHKKISYDQLLTLNHNLELVQSDKLFPVDNSGNGNNTLRNSVIQVMFNTCSSATQYLMKKKLYHEVQR